MNDVGDLAGANGPAAEERDFLATMVAAARDRVATARGVRPLSRPARVVQHHRLRAALEAASARGALGLIAEVKRSSPSKGPIAPDLDAATQARAYAAAGADAVSVLTEPARFGGALADLEAVTAAVDLPALRKDFIVDPYQVWESAAVGAAAVLLIAAALTDDQLRLLRDECDACGLDALAEAHDETDLRRALAAGATLVGVNNRDLRTLTVDLATTERLAWLVPDGVLVVSESGISCARDAHRVADAGARAVLVGESLVRCPPDGLTRLVAALHGVPTEVVRP